MLDFDIPPEMAQAALEQTEELSLADASKVYAVIKATLERLALVGVINVDVQEQALALTRTVGEEISIMIANQRSLEAEFQRLIAAQHQLRHENNKLRKEENEAQIKDVAAKLRGSIEALCDKLKDNPNVAENMAKVASERQGLQGLLARGLEQLQSMRRFPCIAEAVMSEQSRRKEVLEVVEREKTAAKAVSTLRMELKDEKEDHEKTMRQSRAQIASLKEETQKQNKHTYIEAIHTSRELESAGGLARRLEEEELAGLEAELADLEKRHLLEQHVHRASQEQLQRAQAELAGKVAHWGAKTRTDAAEQEQWLQDLSTQHKAMLATFRDVEREHLREKGLKMQRAAEERCAAEAAVASAALTATQSAAATVIQAHWRGYRARQVAKGGKDKGKKGKKKK